MRAYCTGGTDTAVHWTQYTIHTYYTRTLHTGHHDTKRIAWDTADFFLFLYRQTLTNTNNTIQYGHPNQALITSTK
jgi:hypothetical protein